MTIYTLKETLHDRIKMLEAGLDQMMSQPRALVITHTRVGAQELGRLEGRLEEARVIFRLVDQVAHDQVNLAQERRDHPLLSTRPIVFERDEVDDPTPALPGGEDDPDRYDPGRC